MFTAQWFRLGGSVAHYLIWRYVYQVGDWTQAMDERQLKIRLRKCLKGDFELLEEVQGIFPVDNSHVRIDFLARARKHVVDSKGFSHEWFGIEVKGLPNADAANKGKNFAWQSVTYSQSRFELTHGEVVRPIFVVMYPPIDRFFDTHEIVNSTTTKTFQQNAAFQLITFLERSNVGSLNCRKGIWSFIFGTQCYCSKTSKGINSKLNFATKRNVGSLKA
ncbi:hypothetical protein OPW07_22565 [Vibrio europaeus]|uniref:hypothetical protein n=1 Tax=Vibrio europaeus TaxID=300876 RepID=UPI0018A7AC2E|nr:hypothetical protein [Vibrio europaeus]MDC5812514.1 hypothetical protein [Vibrio europaeus]QPG33938.1 hypothetical protein IXK98_07405 [Vibrio europaeus]